MKKLLLSLIAMLMFGMTSYAQTPPAAPSAGIWTLIDTNYQLASTEVGVTNAKITFRNTTTTLVTGLQFRVFYDKNAFSAAVPTLVGTTTNLDLQFVDNNAGGYLTITVVYNGSSSAFTLADGQQINLALTHVAAATFINLPTIANLAWASTPVANVYTTLAAQQDGTDVALNTHNYGGIFLRPQFDFTTNFVNVTGTPAKNLPFKLEKKPKTSTAWASHASYVTDNNGTYAIHETIDATFYDIRLSVDGSTMTVGNVISVADAQLINQFVLGTQTPSGYQYYSADVNGNNSVSIADAYGVFGRIAGRFTAWPNNVKDIKFFTDAEHTNIMAATATNFTSTIAGVTTFTYTILPGTTSVTYHVLVVGDANNTGYNMARLTPITVVNPANSTHNVIDETVEYDTALASVEVNMPSLEVTEGNDVEVPVRILNNASPVGSLQLALNYDSSLLDFKEVQNSGKSMNWLSFVNLKNDVIEWGGYDTTGNNLVTDGEPLFTLIFTAKQPQGDWGASPLYTSRKYVGNQNAVDMRVTPTNGVVQINKMNGTFLVNDMMITPNPTNGEISIKFNVEKSGDAEISLFDITGRKIMTVVDEYMPKGKYTYSTDLTKLADGLYIAKLITKTKSVTDKVIKY
jgi:hypothetical protein